MEVQLSRMRPAELVRLAARLEQISQLLVALRLRFPASDVAAMAAAHPPLLSMTPEQLREAVAAVQREFPDASQVGPQHGTSRSPHLGLLLPVSCQVADIIARQIDMAVIQIRCSDEA